MENKTPTHHTEQEMMTMDKKELVKMIMEMNKMKKETKIDNDDTSDNT